MSEQDIDIRAEVDESIKTFDLKAKLQGRGMRTKSITLYTDEVAAAELGGVRELKDPLTKAVVDTDRWGILGEIDTLRLDNADQSNDQAILDLLDEAEAKKAELDESKIVVQLRALPRIIEKDTRRAARAALGIKGKTIPEDLAEEFDDQSSAELLSRAFVSATQSDGAANTTLSVEEAKLFTDYLPASEVNRLQYALAELQFSNVISDKVTSSADF